MTNATSLRDMSWPQLMSLPFAERERLFLADPGTFTVSSDGRTISSTGTPANETWTGGPQNSISDNDPGSGIAGHVANGMNFTSWTLTKQ